MTPPPRKKNIKKSTKQNTSANFPVSFGLLNQLLEFHTGWKYDFQSSLNGNWLPLSLSLIFKEQEHNYTISGSTKGREGKQREGREGKG